MCSSIKELINSFITQTKNGNIEIYNEFSLQHEIGIYLRTQLPSSYKVQFERNIEYFNIPKEDSPKERLDISIFNWDKKDFLATIELKFLTHGQHPMQMFKICEDIKFMEHTKNHKFKAGYVLVITDDSGFYEEKHVNYSPYCYFRSSQTLTGKVIGSVGKKKYNLSLKGAYNITWHEINNPRKYTLIEVI